MKIIWERKEEGDKVTLKISCSLCKKELSAYLSGPAKQFEDMAEKQLMGAFRTHECLVPLPPAILVN